MSTPTLYEQIGEALIRRAITEFYQRAFADGIIGHFFFRKDHAALTAHQIDFATSMLGGPRRYQGRPLAPLHHDLDIRTPHFARRQVLMAEVLNELGLDPALRDAWLNLEEALRPMIVRRSRPNASPL